MKTAAYRNLISGLGISVLALGGALSPVLAEEELEWDEAELFFELNDTDGDLGIHANIDGGPWKRLTIEDLNERRILNIRASGRLRAQGMTQMAWESAEPSFDELTPEEFFARFPEGEYEIEGVTLDDEELEAVVELSHVLAAPPGNIRVNGQAAAEDCDAAVLPVVTAPVRVIWAPVTTSHPEIGTIGVDVEISRYQFFVEKDDAKLSVDLEPDVTSFKVPASFFTETGIWKYEIIARTEDGNNTAVETCFYLQGS